MRAPLKLSWNVWIALRPHPLSFAASLLQLNIVLNPGSSSSPPADGDLLHVRAVGDNDTLHFLFCSLGAPTLLLIHTNTSLSTVKVNWTQLIDRNNSGGLEVEPKSSILYSTAIVFSRLLEYDDVNDTARPPSELFPPYELQDFSWSRLNLSDPTILLCGTPRTFTNGSLCLRVLFETEGRGETWPRLLHTANSSQVEVWLDGMLPRAIRSRFLLELQAVGGAYPLSRVEAHRTIDDEFTPSIFKVNNNATNRKGDGPPGHPGADPGHGLGTLCLPQEESVEVFTSSLNVRLNSASKNGRLFLSLLSENLFTNIKHLLRSKTLGHPTR
uniref:Glycosylated lysosomal membrane protein n=1 Tax=Mola mola TaxID=94237 RepID=A0A3Q3WXA0_MOLML